MTGLIEYLSHKREAFRILRQRVLGPSYTPVPVHARVTVEGRSGVRRIRLRDHQMLADSPPDFVGYDLGPGSPELALGALGSCLAHSWLIQAAVQGVPLRALEVEVTGQIDQRAGEAGHETTPREPHGIAYTVRVATDAQQSSVAALQEAVDRLCPVLNLLRNPQPITSSVQRVATASQAIESRPAEERTLSHEGVA
jgi:uncharacterized OsmC-like protein